MFKLLALATGAAAIKFNAFQPAGDPECKLGYRSFSADPKAVSVCCPKYCGECSDYETCSTVNGQDSKNACCASSVQKLVCENNSEDPYCLKKCTEKSAPCSLGVVEDIDIPKESPTAAADCNEAVGDFAAACKAAVTGVEPTDKENGGEAQWRALENRANEASDADKKAANPYK